MKKFENKTKNNKELAVKVGTLVPEDAANLAFYSNESINPKNNLAVVDLSESIPENRSFIKSGIKTFFANELGVLEDENGNTIFPTSNLTISDTFINKSYQNEMFEENEINSVEFLHYYYASRFFTAVPGVLNFDDLSEYLDENKIKLLNIKVIDSNNQEYVDINTGRKKYKILLEPFLTEENVEDSEIPHRIIVCLDATKPSGLKLIYDKVECDSDGKVVKQNLRYSETINAHQYFKNNPEESYVVDNSFRKKVYSIKKYNKKYSEIFSDNFDSSGYNVFVPKKALADNRTFEVFNWRLIARSKQSLNLELVDYFWEQQDKIKQKTVNVAVLFDSNDTVSLNNIEPYIFYRLEKSPFNFAKYSFSNPIAPENTSKNLSSYWMVDLNKVDSLEMFDVVSFCPTKELSKKAVEVISNYVRLQNGTIVVDGSNYPSNAPFVISDLYIEEAVGVQSPAYYEYIESNKILNEDKNGGWNINESIFESSDLGIFGFKKEFYRHINSSIPLSKSFLNIGLSQSTAKSVGCLMEINSSKDALTQGNIVFTSFPFLEYCNSIYSITGSSSGDYGIIDSNSEKVAASEQNTNILSAVVEGPFKFLYNCISYGLYSRAYAGSILDTRSSIFNFVGEWNSSWVMNSEALLESEKEKYFTNISISNTEKKQARDLIQNYNSVEDYYLKMIYDSIPTYHRDKLSLLDLSKVDFFLEITNPDITINKSTKISDQQQALDEFNIPTSYTLFKLTEPTQKAYAYTDTISPLINIPDGFGPYVVKEIPSIKSSDTKKISNLINPINYFKSYPFKLETYYSYQTATDKPLIFSGKYSTNIKIQYQGIGEFEQVKPVGVVIRNWETEQDSSNNTTNYVPPSGGVDPIVSPGQPLNNIPCQNIKSVIDMFQPQGQITTVGGFRWRSFEYTWDINAGNTSATIAQGSSGEYVRFIQSALKSGGFYNAEIDGSFGPVTTAAVTAFQNFMTTYKPVYTTNGTIDSETKSHIAFCIRNGIRGMDRGRNAGSPKFYDAIFKQKELANINSGERHRKISYSGSAGVPIENVKDVLFFTIPSGLKHINSVVIDIGTEAGRWMNYKAVKYGWSSQDKSDSITRIPDIWSQYTTREINQSPAANGQIVLNVDQDISAAKYMYVHIISTGTINPIFGSAEGYQINSIVCNGLSSGSSLPVADPPDEESNPIENSETYVIFPSLKKPEIEDIANFYLEGTSDLFYDGSDLKSNTEGFLLYTIEDDAYWSWDDGSGSWDSVVFDETDEVIKRLEDRSKTFTYTVDAIVSAIDSGTFNSLSPSSSFNKLYDTQTIKSFNLLLTDISYTYLEQSYNDLLGTGLGLATANHKTPSGVVFDFTKPSYVYIVDDSSVAIFDVVNESGSTVTSPLSSISITYSGISNPLANKYTRFSMKTLGTFYSGSDVIVTNPKVVENYTMMDINKKIVPSKESVTILDGTVLICNSNGKPTGLPSGSEISSSFPSSLLDQEKDSRFGFIYTINTIGVDNIYTTNTIGAGNDSGGFIYGFYDIQEKEFLGNKISYVDLLSRGLNNVYLAVSAIDADGNSNNQIDFIGPKVSLTFLPVDVPIKRICPVYSVSFSSNSAIKIGDLGSFIDKKEAWPLPITSGSFMKKINLEETNRFFDWKSNYLGQTLLATYDTSSVSLANWSSIFGKGYYDVKNEKPIIVSGRQIKLRQAPFLVWPEPSNYELSLVGVFKPKFEIYIKSSEESNWTKVELSQIRDYDAETGMIEFNQRIVPSNQNLIKVNYVRISPDLLVYNVDSDPIPLNPFLNYENIKLNKALYIYLLPSKINKFSSKVGIKKYVPLEEYSGQSPINFTYDYQMFNSSSIKYNPFALLIGIVYFINNPNRKQTRLSDTRLRGGGIKANIGLLELDESNKDVIHNWDVYPSHGTSYAKGGYVIIKLPEEVKQNFNSVQEIYDIVRSNLTAGVSFEIQNLNGEPWEI